MVAISIKGLIWRVAEVCILDLSWYSVQTGASRHVAAANSSNLVGGAREVAQIC